MTLRLQADRIRRAVEKTDLLQRLQLTRSDQIFVASLLLVGVGWLFTQWVGDRNGMVDLDEVPIRQYGLKIHANEAKWPEFVVLPGIGRTLAKRIVEHREISGPYCAAEDLLAVHGIGPKIIERLRPYLVFGAEAAALDD